MKNGGIVDVYIHNDLKEPINKKRQEMIDLAFKKGFTDQETVKCSQELDELLNLSSQTTWSRNPLNKMIC